MTCVYFIFKQALGLLKALAGNDDIKITIVKSGGVQLILAAMTYHQGRVLFVSPENATYTDYFRWCRRQRRPDLLVRSITLSL